MNPHFLLSTIITVVFAQMTKSLSSSPKTQRIALITGSNKGIGLEIAKKLGAEKMEDGKTNTFICILGCRNEELGNNVSKELKEKGMDVDFVKIDLENDETITSAVKYIENTYGHCDVLINNAAVCFNDPTLYGKVPHAPFDKQADITIRTNFFGTLHLTNAMIPLLEKSNYPPRIINIASSAGRLSILPSQTYRDAFSSKDLQMNDLENYMRSFVKSAKQGTHVEDGWPNTGYGVSKVGIIAMTRILARENSKFMVNSVDPGYCATDQNNNQGFISAERGAVTPFLLATLQGQFFSGMHWYQEQEIAW